MIRKQIRFDDVRQDVNQYLKAINRWRHPIALLLDGVDDVRNLGAIFRLADAARVEKIYSIHTKNWTADKRLRRVSRATEQFVPYEHLHDFTAIFALKAQRPLIGVEWTNDSIPYTQFSYPARGCTLVLGNEERGISNALLPLLDACVHIPMYGVKTSLNVAVAAGIVVYSLLEMQILPEVPSQPGGTLPIQPDCDSTRP